MTDDKRLELIPDEFYDVGLVLNFGATKYEPRNWEEKNGIKADFKQQHDSMFHHLAESFAGWSRHDQESDLDPLLHLACRALMCYTRIKREID